MDKQNISRDEIAQAMQNEFGFNRKQCLDIVNEFLYSWPILLLPR